MKLVGTLILAAGAALAAPADTAPTYNKDIAPILYKNCAGCHRPGEVAPFSLLTYQDAAKRAALIATVTKGRVMPPWKAEPGYGHFQDERRLTDDQIALIGAWAKSGTPEGDAASRPTPPTFTDGWQLGKPDRIVSIPAKFAVPADGPDQFRCFVIPLNLEQDVHIGAAEFRADNRRVVHHALLFTDPTGQGRKMAAGSADGGYTCFGGPGIPAGLLGGWAPGQVPVKPMAGYAATLRKGTDLVLQVHYHPSGKPEQDQSSYGFFFTDPPTKGRALAIVGNNRIDITPGDKHYVVKASAVVPSDTALLRITPHAHYLCKDMKVTAHLPDGTTVPLIWIKDWDFNWQGSYSYATPVQLPKGTRVDMEYTYDNSEANPRNPAKPPVRVTYGEQTTNEMALVFLSFSVPTPQDAVTFTRDMFLSQMETASQER
jgi:mono/diheme cytochrome c family protein